MSPACLCHEHMQQLSASCYLLNFLIMGCCDILITDWIAGVVVNGEHHVELEEVHQLHKQPRCTAHMIHVVQKHANNHSIVTVSILRQCTKFYCEQHSVIAWLLAEILWHVEHAHVSKSCWSATASETCTYI